MYKRAIGNRIRQARLKKGMTQEQVVNFVDISIPHYSNIERGKISPSLETLLKIINAIDGVPNEIFQDVIQNKSLVYSEKELSLFEGCTEKEVELILENIRVLKEALKQKRN